MTPISLDPNVSSKLDRGMRDSDLVELPFPVIYLWALNGQASYKAQAQATPGMYYGGWACKTAEGVDLAAQLGVSLPRDWKPSVIASRDGSEFDALTTRSLIVAPICKRESWLTNGKRSADYLPGGRRHLQVLVYLAEKQGQNGSATFAPWGPVVLTAKGYQARNLLDAFAAWTKGTAVLRRKVAPGVPAWCFYLALGTFGDRHVEQVGKPGAQSPITPLKVYIPEKLDEAKLSSLFVGSEVADRMAEMADEAQEWLGAWSAGALPAAGAPAAAAAPDAPENWAEDEPHYEDEIPF